MARLTLFLLLDAFRPDYLRDAPFLASLAGQGSVGRLREPFGFLPRAAYFGGLPPEAVGYTHMFRQAAGDSPFAVSRFLPPSLLTALSPPMPARRFVDGQARRRLPAYARYASSMRVPPAILPHLAVTEDRAPWDPSVGYRSLFHELTEAGLPWLACAWPESGQLEDPGDAGIVADVRRRLTPEHRFAFVHLQELDSAGHYHGPESAVLRDLVRRTDEQVHRLLTAARTTHRAVDVVAFGDHGMVSVTRTVDVRPALAASGLAPGLDYLYFLDSTMVRLWYLTSRSRPALRRALSGIEGLRWLDEAGAARHRIAGCDPKNGHDLLLADPGVLVWPDFFASGGPPPKGMHGYDPDCPDNQGLFLLWRSDQTDGRRDAGVVDATALHDVGRRLTGLDPAPVALGPRTAAAPLTACRNAGAEARVRRDLHRLVTAIRACAPAAEAIVLTGSFGRGEGGIRWVDGRPVPVNDYDLAVIGGPDAGEALAALGGTLRTELGLDFLDLAWYPGELSSLPLTMAHFDLKYGSRVLWGDATVLGRMPLFAAADLPLQEGLTLLLNRSAGILTGLNRPVERAADWTCEERLYLGNQLAKAAVALGDWHLLEWQAYDSSYGTRAARFAALAPGAQVPPAVVTAVSDGYARKLRPDLHQAEGAAGGLERLVPLLLQGVRRACSRTYSRRVENLPQAAAAIRGVTGAWIEGDNERLSGRPEVARILRDGFASSTVSIRQTLYSALPMLLAQAAPAVNGQRLGSHLHDAVDALQVAFGFETPRAVGRDSWDAVRGPVVRAWLAMTH